MAAAKKKAENELEDAVLVTGTQQNLSNLLFFRYLWIRLIDHGMYSQHFLLTNRSNKLECYTTLSWKGLEITNTLDYWVCFKVTKKMNCCEYGSGGPIQNTSFSS